MDTYSQPLARHQTRHFPMSCSSRQSTYRTKAFADVVGFARQFCLSQCSTSNTLPDVAFRIEIDILDTFCDFTDACVRQANPYFLSWHWVCPHNFGRLHAQHRDKNNSYLTVFFLSTSCMHTSKFVWVFPMCN